MELYSIACPVECLGLVGNQEAGLSNYIHPSQVSWERINFHADKENRNNQGLAFFIGLR